MKLNCGSLSEIATENQVSSSFRDSAGDSSAVVECLNMKLSYVLRKSCKILNVTLKCTGSQ